MNFFLSITPIIIIIYLMIGRRWSAARAGAAGYLSTLVIAIASFGSGPALLAYAHAKALVLSSDVLIIIWAAFVFYKVCDEAGAIRTIGQSLPHLTTDRGMMALIVGWVFASFLQGVGGFGVPVAVTAPILAGLGFSPLISVLLPSLGHGWAVTFGSLGSSFQALINTSGETADVLAPASAVFLGVVCIFTGPIIAHAVGGWQAVRRLLLPALLIGVGMAFTQYIIATSGLWNIGSFCASLIGLAISVPLAYLINRKNRSQGKINLKTLLVAFSGYFIMVFVILGAQFIPQINTLFKQGSIIISYPETITTTGFVVPAGASREIFPFGHPGMLLLYASLLAFLFYKFMGTYSPDLISRIVNGTFQRVLSSSISIISMITMAVIMEHAGMTNAIANGLAAGLSTLFPIISPWIGALGAFMTGSNTNSNAIFAGLQKQIAQLLKISVPIILAAQTTGGSIGSMAAPTKIVVGLSTLGIVGREGDILRLIVGYITFLVALVSLLTVIGILFTQ